MTGSQRQHHLLRKTLLQRPKWTSHCDGAWIGTTNYLWMAELLGSKKGYTMWIIGFYPDRSMPNWGFVAQFALQRLTFHLTLLTFDKSDLVGINSTHLLLALWCFSPLDPKSWRRYLGWENNLICEKHRNPPWVNSEFYAWTWYNMINIINKIWWYEWNLLKYSLSRNGLAWSHPARQLAKQDQRIMSGLLSGQGWPIFGGKIGKKSPHWL